MAPTPIELSLASLLPTAADLPTEITALAQSLLSQSKIKAAHLKPEEEVGRIYACCHIAAERLKNKHGLDVEKARPPVPPRVYGKLKGFLEGVLAAPTTPKGRGGKAAEAAVSGTASAKKTPESAPTSMRKRWAEARKPQTAAEGQRGENGPTGLDPPEYAMPMIRHLCKACKTEKAAPHVFTGLSVILKEHGKPGETEGATPASGRKRKRATLADQVFTSDDVPGLILALFVDVTRRMYGNERLVEEDYVEAAQSYARDEQHGPPSTAADEFYFDDALARLTMTAGTQQPQWTEMEWFGNIPVAGSIDQQDGDAASDDHEDIDVTPARKKPAKTPLRRKEKHGKFEDDYNDVGRAGLLPGLGTMFQPAVDWLSEDKMIEFERWKRDVGRKIAAIEGKG